MPSANPSRGYALGIAAYLIWGLFPLYFKAIQSVPALEIIVHRALWSALFGALLLLPMASKLLGNWLGLSWATPSFTGASKWRESLLLNIRGLSEIVFLNLLLQQQLIGPALYFALMLMGLIATLLPALAGMNKPPLKSAVTRDKEPLCQ